MELILLDLHIITNVYFVSAGESSSSGSCIGLCMTIIFCAVFLVIQMSLLILIWIRRILPSSVVLKMVLQEFGIIKRSYVLLNLVDVKLHALIIWEKLLHVCFRDKIIKVSSMGTMQRKEIKKNKFNYWIKWFIYLTQKISKTNLIQLLQSNQNQMQSDNWNFHLMEIIFYLGLKRI